MGKTIKMFPIKKPGEIVKRIKGAPKPKKKEKKYT